MAYIYKITNDINQKVYIGKTECSIEKRFKEHCHDSSIQGKKKRPLYSAMNKYGIEHFHIGLIEETSYPEERECYWIQFYNSYHNGYNATYGGNGRHYLDYDKIISEYQRCKNQKEVAKNLNIDSGTVHKVLISNHIDIVKAPNKGSKKVRMLKRESSESQVFSSCGEAARFLLKEGITSAKVGTVTSKITDCCNGRRKSAYNCLWNFVGD